MKTTLAVMAAGLGSRYGGIKQVEPMGPHGEILMDYAIYDSLRAGFDKVVFIIKKEMLNDFRDVIGKRIEKKTEVAYTFQTFESLPSFYSVPEGRIKPFGTAHALLCARDSVKEPFAIINSDDFYGRSAFDTMHAWLSESEREGKQASMIGYFLENTVSEHGSVTRGICGVRDGKLTGVKETYKITVFPDGSIRDIYEDERGLPLDRRSLVSMNFWGFYPSVFGSAEDYLRAFLKSLSQDDVKSECLLPAMVDHLMRNEGFSVKVLSTDAKWFGVTYKEDKEIVKNKLKLLYEQNAYPDLINS
jgi:NDP-sugar pyrophosphorylase family protein